MSVNWKARRERAKPQRAPCRNCGHVRRAHVSEIEGCVVEQGGLVCACMTFEELVVPAPGWPCKVCRHERRHHDKHGVCTRVDFDDKLQQEMVCTCVNYTPVNENFTAVCLNCGHHRGAHSPDGTMCGAFHEAKDGIARSCRCHGFVTNKSAAIAAERDVTVGEDPAWTTPDHELCTCGHTAAAHSAFGPHTCKLIECACRKYVKEKHWHSR